MDDESFMPGIFCSAATVAFTAQSYQVMKSATALTSAITGLKIAQRVRKRAEKKLKKAKEDLEKGRKLMTDPRCFKPCPPSGGGNPFYNPLA